MNYEEAKKLKYGDIIKIDFPGHMKSLYGKFNHLTKRGYIHYNPKHLAPPGQKAHMKYVEPIMKDK